MAEDQVGPIRVSEVTEEAEHATSLTISPHLPHHTTYTSGVTTTGGDYAYTTDQRSHTGPDRGRRDSGSVGDSSPSMRTAPDFGTSRLGDEAGLGVKQEVAYSLDGDESGLVERDAADMGGAEFDGIKAEILPREEESGVPSRTGAEVTPLTYESLTHGAAFAEFTNTLRAEHKLLDVSLCCGGAVVMAHRLVLVAHSRVLYDIIGADQECSYVSLDHLAIPGTVIAVVLDFLYTGVVRVLPEEKADVLEAARALDIPRLVEILDTLPAKRKRGRPRKNFAVLTSKTAAALRKGRVRAPGRPKLKSAPVVPSNPAKRRKRGRPRKCDAVTYLDVADEEEEEAVIAPPAQDSDGDDYLPDAADDGEIAGDDKDDVDFNAKKQSVTKVKKTRGRGRPPLAKKPKKVLTEEEQEQKRIELEKKRNRPKPIKTPEGMFKCPVEGCAYISHTDSFIYNHIRNHSDERPFPCPHCEKRFKMKKHLEVHIRVHTGERPYACEVCGKRFKASKHRNRHRRVHTGEKIGFCEECGKGFSSNNQLNRHVMAVHRKERPFKCEDPDCKYAAADRSTLRQHMLQHTRDPNNPDANKDILCETCGKGFLSQNSLRLHRLSHTGEDLVCPDCEYTSKYKSAMESHVMRRHGKTMSGRPAEKKWRCDQCVYACFTENEFNMHMMKHRGEKPHKCPICDFATVDKGTLKKHMRHHTGEMPFKCKVCAKAFSSQSGLARHRRIHLGIKPHKCELCEKAYADRKSLKAHQFTHMNIKPFECHVCVYSCVKKEYLLKHIQKAHGEHSVPDHLKPNPDHKKYRPKSLFPLEKPYGVEAPPDSAAESGEAVHVVVEETHPDNDTLGEVDYNSGQAAPFAASQPTTYTTVSDIAAVHGLVENYQAPALYPLNQYSTNH